MKHNVFQYRLSFLTKYVVNLNVNLGVLNSNIIDSKLLRVEVKKQNIL